MIRAERTFGATPGFGPTMSLKFPVVVVLPLGQAKATPLEVTVFGDVKPTTLLAPSSHTVLMFTLRDSHVCVSVTVSLDCAKPDWRSSVAVAPAEPSMPWPNCALTP